VQSSEKEGAIENNKANIFLFQRGVVRLSYPKPMNKISIHPYKRTWNCSKTAVPRSFQPAME
jgi:hypothetical protein